MKLEERKGDMTKFFIILTVNHCIRIEAIAQCELVRIVKYTPPLTLNPSLPHDIPSKIAANIRKEKYTLIEQSIHLSKNVIMSTYR